jgi:PhzF family phenazine biosynthesis protein|nr:phenazine biosynthesis protein PhzF [Aeromicrobium sp.]
MRFSQVDVFTDELMDGNPVAVVHDADGVSDEDMAAFARWTNLSETTFLLAPTDPAADYRLRIFTTYGELPFAGHPTLGSARAWLAAGGVARQPGQLVQECGAGLVRVRDAGGRLAFAAPPLRRSGPVDEADVLEVVESLGLSRSDVVDAQWADNGPGWVALLLASADAVLAVEPGAFGEIDKVGIVGPHAPGSGADFEVRAFFPGGEDPVTGSLNAGIAQWLIGSGQAPESYVAAQGTLQRRRGRVHVGQVDDDIWIGGDTVVGITGTVDL